MEKKNTDKNITVALTALKLRFYKNIYGHCIDNNDGN